MENKLQIFKYANQEVRAVMLEDNPWWVAKDVCDILGLVNSRKAVSALKDSQKADVTLSYTSSNGTIQNRAYAIINEPGLYKLIMRSRKPDAEKFQDWIAEEVLPTIRKTGAYFTDNMWEQITSNPEKLGELLIDYGRVRKELQTSKDKILIDMPKVDFFNAVTDSKDAIEMSQVAKVLDMGIGRNSIFQILRDQKVLRYNNEPYQAYIDSGHFRSIEQKWITPEGETRITIKTLVYQKGMVLIKQLIDELGKE